MAPLNGAGYLRAIDRLMDASYLLFQPVVNLSFPAPIVAGSQTIAVSDPSYKFNSPSFYVGALLVCGTTGGSLEVVTITAATPTSFTAVFANAHAAGEPILGATFPVRQTSGDQLFTQAEMIGYLSTACNDFLTECPVCYALGTVTVPPSAFYSALASDCMVPARVAAASYPLAETSQTDLDMTDYQWNLDPLSQPQFYYRDKIPVQNVGVYPRAGNKVDLEVIYQQRQAQTMGWGDGFLFPDPLTIYPLYRTMAFAFSKDGEVRSPALAKYFDSRYRLGVGICNMLLAAINDPQLQVAAQ